MAKWSIYTCGILSLFLLIISIVLLVAHTFMEMVESDVKKATVLKNGTEVYSAWADPPPPIYMKFYFFNVTNPLEVLDGEKPVVDEIGPYVYRFYDCKAAVAAKIKQGTSRGNFNTWQRIFAERLMSETSTKASGGQEEAEAEVDRPNKRQRAAASSTCWSSSPPGPSGATSHSGERRRVWNAESGIQQWLIPPKQSIMVRSTASVGTQPTTIPQHSASSGRSAPAATVSKLHSNNAKRLDMRDEDSPPCNPPTPQTPTTPAAMHPDSDGSDGGLDDFSETLIQALLQKPSSFSPSEEVLGEIEQDEAGEHFQGNESVHQPSPSINTENPAFNMDSGPSISDIYALLLTQQTQLKEQSKKITELSNRMDQMMRHQTNLIQLLMVRQEAARRRENEEMLLHLLEAISRQNSPFPPKSMPHHQHPQ